MRWHRRIFVRLAITCVSSGIWKSFVSPAERWRLWEEFGCSVRNGRELGFCGLYCSPVDSVISTIFYFNPAGRFLDVFVLMLYCFYRHVHAAEAVYCPHLKELAACNEFI